MHYLEIILAVMIGSVIGQLIANKTVNFMRKHKK